METQTDERLGVRPDLERRVQEQAQVRRMDPQALLDSILEAGLGLTPEERADAVIASYQRGELSHGEAAGRLGLTRAAFLEELGRRRVPAIQSDADEMLAEAGLG